MTAPSPTRHHAVVGFFVLSQAVSTLSFVFISRTPCRLVAGNSWRRKETRLWDVNAHQDAHSSDASLPSIRSTNDTEFDNTLLREENLILRDTIRQLELENERLRNGGSSKIVIENFEGERKLPPEAIWFEVENVEKLEGITIPGEQMEQQMMWCDELEQDQCPVEPTISFGEALRDRAYWLVGLLTLQSCSGFILARNEMLLAKHPVIIFFLTMLVGAGGNAGNQASVRVIRGLALGTLNERTQGQFLARELKMSAALSGILSLAGFARAAVFRTPFAETVAITTSLAMIVFSSICLGAVLPLLLKKLGVDPAHSSTTIQVVMDILGVVLTVVVSSLMLDSTFGQFLISKLSFSA